MSLSSQDYVDRERHGPLPAQERRWWLWLAALLLALIAIPAHAQTFPAFTGYVVDDAHLLPADVAQQLTAKLDALEKTTHRQLIVATIPDLQGYPIEDYGYKLGRAWAVGQKETNNGTILIVAPNDRKVRIEVGYGLEPVLTDALSSIIISQQILPRFKAGDMAGGVVAGTQAIIDQLAAPDAEAKAQADAAAAQVQKAKQSGGSGIAVAFWALFIGIIFFSIIGRAARSGGVRSSRFGGGGGGGGIMLWTALNVIEGISRSGGSGGGGSWGGGGGGGGFGGGGGGSFGGGGASGGW